MIKEDFFAMVEIYLNKTKLDKGYIDEDIGL